MRLLRLSALGAVSVFMALAGPSGAFGSLAQAGTIQLQGAGATFPYPLYSKWVSEYEKVDADVRINYQSIGSGGGIKQIVERTVDFGASDAPMSDAELAKASGKLLHILTTLGAVVVAYNVPGVASGLKLSQDALARIYLGEITKWNDPAIVSLNAGVKLPADSVTVVYRTDGSGTTSIFTSYLAAVSPDWKTKVGEGKSVRFPVGLGAKGNEGVAGQVKSTPGSIGYTELAYAKQTGLAFASIRNRAGKFAEPTLEAITAAAGAAAAPPDDLRMSIVDATGEASYPIAAFTYILVYDEQKDATSGKALTKFLWWAIHDGQKLGAPLYYAPLPAAIVKRIEAKLHSIKAGGQAAL